MASVSSAAADSRCGRAASCARSMASVYSGARQDLPATGDLDQLDAVPFDVVVLADLVERRGDGRRARVVIERRELFRSVRTRAREERRLKQLR